MNETPEQETDPLELRIQAVSALEKALREALAIVPLEQVLHHVTVMFPKARVESIPDRAHGFMAACKR